MKVIVLVLLLVIPSVAAAECDTQALAAGSSTERNGLYYSTTGREEDAARVRLGQIDGNPVRLQMIDGQSLNYAFGGKLFVRTGVGGEPWLNLSQPHGGEEAVSVTTQTRSATTHEPEYVSLSRDTIPAGACFLIEEPKRFFDEEDRSYKFVSENKFALFHSREIKKQSNRTLKDYHFEFGRIGDECFKTREIYRNRDGDRVLVTNEVFNTETRNTPPPRKITRLTGQAGSEVERVIIGSPAYAREDSVDRPKVSSLMSSLHYVDKAGDKCLALPVPIPTSSEAGFFKRFIFGDDADRRKSEQLAKSGEFLPKMSEMVFKKVREDRKAGFIRLYWTQP